MTKHISDAVTLAAVEHPLLLGLDADVRLDSHELRVASERVPLLDVSHVGLIDRPARTPTRRLVQLGATSAGLLVGGADYVLTGDLASGVAVMLVAMLLGVLASDWAEARFPTPGRYGILVSRRSGAAVRVDGLRSEEAAHLLHERVAAAVRHAQGLNG